MTWRWPGARGRTRWASAPAGTSGRSCCVSSPSPASTRWWTWCPGWRSGVARCRYRPSPRTGFFLLSLLPIRDHPLQVLDLLGRWRLLGRLRRRQGLFAVGDGALRVLLLGEQQGLGAQVGVGLLLGDRGVDPAAGVVEAGVVLDAPGGRLHLNAGIGSIGLAHQQLRRIRLDGEGD